jgi:hypothetical protein
VVADALFQVSFSAFGLGSEPVVRRWDSLGSGGLARAATSDEWAQGSPLRNKRRPRATQPFRLQPALPRHAAAANRGPPPLSLRSGTGPGSGPGPGPGTATPSFRAASLPLHRLLLLSQRPFAFHRSGTRFVSRWGPNHDAEMQSGERSSPGCCVKNEMGLVPAQTRTLRLQGPAVENGSRCRARLLYIGPSILPSPSPSPVVGSPLPHVHSLTHSPPPPTRSLLQASSSILYCCAEHCPFLLALSHSEIA